MFPVVPTCCYVAMANLKTFGLIQCFVTKRLDYRRQKMYNCVIIHLVISSLTPLLYSAHFVVNVHV